MDSTHPSIPTINKKDSLAGHIQSKQVYPGLFLFGAGRSSVDLLFELLKSQPCSVGHVIVFF